MREYHDPDIKILLCDYRKKISSWEHENVFNSWWYLYWNNTPGAIVRTGKQEHRLEPGHVCLIAPETAFSTESKSSFNHFYIHFTAGTPFDQIKSHIYFFPIQDLFRKPIERLQTLSPLRSEKTVQMSLLSHSLVCSVLSEISETDFAALRKLDFRIENAVKILNDETSTVFSNEMLAENVGMSVNSFIRLFMSNLGVTPQKYSRRKRIEKASILLHFTDKKMEEIAKETGFLDRYHFSRVFREITNYSPADFRKRRISF